MASLTQYINKLIVTIIGLVCSFSLVRAQVEVSSSQFMNTQFFINPGYTGIQKVMNISGMARQQWVGIEGAPQKYQVGIDSPLNNSTSGLGGGLQIEKQGPVSINMIQGNYAKLIRLSKGSFLSLGFSGLVSNYSLGLHDLDLNHPEDPNFNANINNAFAANIGVGAFLFTQNYYLGISAPRLLKEKPFVSEENSFGDVSRFLYLSTGYLYQLNKYLALKPAMLIQMKETEFNYLSIGTQLVYNNRLFLGGLYQTQGWLSFLVNLQISESINVGYSFDYGLNSTFANHNSHEVSLKYSIYNLYRKNRDRDFIKRTKKKKKVQVAEESMKNLRHF